ncbi:MAG: thioesterase family protein [Pseudomonadota bacterium]
MTKTIIENPEFQTLLKHVMEEKIPFCHLLGIKLETFDPDNAQISIEMREQLLGNFSQGMLHGGVIASVLDTMAGFAILLKMAQQSPKDDVMSQLKEFSQMSTIDLRIDYLQPGRGKKFFATAEVTRLGKRVANVLMNLHNETGDRIATGAAAFMLHGRA